MPCPKCGSPTIHAALVNPEQYQRFYGTPAPNPGPQCHPNLIVCNECGYHGAREYDMLCPVDPTHSVGVIEGEWDTPFSNMIYCANCHKKCVANTKRYEVKVKPREYMGAPPKKGGITTKRWTEDR